MAIQNPDRLRLQSAAASKTIKSRKGRHKEDPPRIQAKWLVAKDCDREPQQTGTG